MCRKQKVKHVRVRFQAVSFCGKIFIHFDIWRSSRNIFSRPHDHAQYTIIILFIILIHIIRKKKFILYRFLILLVNETIWSVKFNKFLLAISVKLYYIVQ